VEDQKPSRRHNEHGQTDITAPDVFVLIPHLAIVSASTVPFSKRENMPDSVSESGIKNVD